HGKDWEPYWKSEDTALVHFIGKDNIVFHCLIFPAILKAHGDFILPVNVPANQFLNLEGRKLSTSKNWAVWVHEYCTEFEGQEDVLRYNMVKKMPEQSDSEFTWKGFQETNNNELVNNLANFVQRVLVLSQKYYGSVVPRIDHELTFKSGWDDEKTGQYNEELKLLYDKLKEMGAAIERYELREALRIVMEISSAGNALLQFNEPWKTAKESPEMVKVVLNLAVQYVAVLSVAVRPFLPFAAERLRNMLNLSPLQENGDLLDVLNELVEGNPVVPPQHALNNPEHLFSRISDEVIDQQIAKLTMNIPTETIVENTSNSPDLAPIAYKPIAESIQFEDFAKLDLRTGTIVSAEKMEKSKKLLKLSVDLGLETRTILSGIAEHFTPEQIIGQQVVIVANLAPRVMMGTESQGMVLMAEDAAGKLSFVSPVAEWPNGMGVK
ncbi:MAG: methionine--tRNA ligase subunit beta, partial [Saprospiraceae bacterium]